MQTHSKTRPLAVAGLFFLLALSLELQSSGPLTGSLPQQVASVIGMVLTLSVLAASAGLLARLIQALHRLGSGSGSRDWRGTFLPAVLLTVPFVRLFLQLAERPGAAKVVGIGIYKWVAVGCVLTGLWGLSCWYVRWLRRIDSRTDAAAFLRLAGAVPLAGVAFLVLEVSRRVVPLHYEDIHTLALMVSLGCSLIGGLILFRGQFGSASLQFLSKVVYGLSLLGVFSIVSDRVPGTDAVMRSTLLNETRVTRRVLGWASPLWRSREAETTGDRSYTVGRLPRLTPEGRRQLDERFPDRRRASILWVSIDTLRADHCGFMGYEKHPVTPHLDALARESVVFDNAYAQYSSSQLSMASMFTGLYPAATESHRLARPDGRFETPPIEPVLQRQLQQGGWITQGSSAFSNSFLNGIFAYIPPMFQNLNPGGNESLLPADAVVRRGIEMMARTAQSPWFFWLHLFDPHDPYEPHEDFDFGSEPIDLYDGEVAYADRQLGRFIDDLKQKGRWDNTIVIVHSDHGEEFGEHEGRFHHSTLYEEQIRVPLLIRVPGLSPRRVQEPVELLDLPATLSQILDVKPAATHGDDLTPLMLGHRASAAADAERQPFACAQLRINNMSRGRLDAFRMGNEKAIYNRLTGLWELYDLATDPGEQNNLALESPKRLGVFEKLRTSIEARCTHPTSSEPTVLDLIEQVSVKTGKERLGAARELCRRGSYSRVLTQVPELLSGSESAATRELALAVISVFGDSAGPDRLREILKSGSLQEKTLAANAIARLNPPWGREVLSESLRDDPSLNEEVVLGPLAGLGDREAAARLKTLAQSRPLQHEIRRWGEMATAEGGALAEAWSALILSDALEWPTVLYGLDLAGRQSTPDAMAALYGFFAAKPRGPHHNRELLRLLKVSNLEQTLPLLRLIIQGKDADLREEMFAFLQTQNRVKEIEYLRLVRQQDKPSQDSTARSVQVAELFELTTKRGLDDWGLLIEMFQLATPGLEARLDGSLKRGGFLAATLLRATGLFNDPRPALPVLSHEGPKSALHLSGRRFVLRLRVDVAVGGGPILSGLSSKGHRLRVFFQAKDGRSQWIKSIRFPLAGCQSGDSRFMCVPLLLSPEQRQEGQLIVEVLDHKGTRCGNRLLLPLTWKE